jgi:hypothetical protein
MATTALNLHSALGERRELEAELAACREACIDAAIELDAIYSDLIKTPTATDATLDKLARVRTALRHGRNGK